MPLGKLEAISIDLKAHTKIATQEAEILGSLFADAFSLTIAKTDVLYG